MHLVSTADSSGLLSRHLLDLFVIVAAVVWLATAHCREGHDLSSATFTDKAKSLKIESV